MSSLADAGLSENKKKERGWPYIPLLNRIFTKAGTASFAVLSALLTQREVLLRGFTLPELLHIGTHFITTETDANTAGGCLSTRCLSRQSDLRGGCKVNSLMLSLSLPPLTYSEEPTFCHSSIVNRLAGRPPRLLGDEPGDGNTVEVLEKDPYTHLVCHT
ncbi:hypothetical protein CEXT_453521 [Caerostris extrusa]|uniref:Uncharacterized protein n=1 Tax=Caerostris extrusa TaxID=172846 RepID=A0AAV4S5J7_CAEEX|nr:hypothetical protein CEXT_453521 [Caerostris extrusa]